MTIELKPYRISLSTHARLPWTSIRVRNSQRNGPWYKHFVWGRLSLRIDTPDLDEVQICPHCNGDVEHLGEDGIDFCAEGCGCIEGDKTTYITVREAEARQ